jgi:hypothetical protein
VAGEWDAENEEDMVMVQVDNIFSNASWSRAKS